MTNVTDNKIKKAVAGSICLDGDREKAILDELEVVGSNEDSIELKTGDRSTYDLIISCAHWPQERKSILDSIRSHVDSDPTHTETSDEWLHGGTTLILKERLTGLPSHATTSEDWLGKSGSLKDEDFLARVTSVPSHAETSEKWAQRDSATGLMSRVTAVPSHRSTDDKWLDRMGSILPTDGNPNGWNSRIHESTGQTNEKKVTQTSTADGQVPVGMTFAELDHENIPQRTAWLPSNDGDKAVHSKIAAGTGSAPIGSQTGKSENVSNTASRGKVSAKSAHRNAKSDGAPNDAEFQTVRTSLPPPHQQTPYKKQWVIWVLAVTAVCLAGLVVLLAVMRQSKRGTETNVISSVMIQPALDPETEVQPISGKVVTGGPKQTEAKPQKSKDSGKDTADIRPIDGKVISQPAAVHETSATEAEVSADSADAARSSVQDESGNDHTAESAKGVDKEKSGIPDKELISRAMAALAPSIQSCVINKKGTLEMKFEVREHGAVVITETVDKVFANTTTGFCASSVARSVKLPYSPKDEYIFYHTFKL